MSIIIYFWIVDRCYFFYGYQNHFMVNVRIFFQLASPITLHEINRKRKFVDN